MSDQKKPQSVSVWFFVGATFLFLGAVFAFNRTEGFSWIALVLMVLGLIVTVAGGVQLGREIRAQKP